MSKARDSVEFLNSPDDREVWRAKRAIIGFDDDSDITNNTQPLTSNSMLIRYSSDYANTETANAIQAQRYIMADTGSRGATYKAYTILGAVDSTTGTPVEGDYQPEWCVNVELDNYSTLDTEGTSCGLSSTVRRYSVQGVIGLHCNAMDMRCPDTASDPDMGGITGIECHSDGIGPDHRTSGGTGYGYRQTIRCTARTQSTMPTWTKRGTPPMNDGAAVALDDICLPKDAVVVESYTGPYFVCTTAGTLGSTNTVLDAATTPLTEVTDGTAVWECRVGTEVGSALRIMNGSDTGGDELPGYYRYGIIVTNDAELGNLNEIAHAIYVSNSGLVNFESYGDPDFHGEFFGIAASARLALGSETGTAGALVGELMFRANNANGAKTTFANIAAQSIDDTTGSEDGRLTLTATVAGSGTEHVYLEGLNTVVGLKAIMETTATAGFLHIGRCAGAPTGVPDLYTGKCPMVVDSTNGRLYVYHTGAWHYAALT